MHEPEVLVIGAGVIGNSIAYHVALQKRRVLVVDSAGVAAAPSASSASAGGIRRQGRHRAEVALAIEAVGRWPKLDAELDADLGYRQGGNLLLAENEAEADRLRRFVGVQRRKGLADVRLVDGAELRVLVPGCAPHVVAGSFSPADGQADPVATTRALAAAAERQGAMIWTDTTCRELLRSGSRITGARTARGDVAAQAVVLAAGAWSAELATTAGVDLPMRTQALQMVRSTPGHERALGPVLSAVGRALSLKQSSDGSFLLGGGWIGDAASDGRGCSPRQESIDGNWTAGCAIFPALAELRVDRAWCGLESMSDDDLPLIGCVPGLDGLYLASGFSGHGFAIAPSVGRAVADELAGKTASELERLRPGRFPRLTIRG